MKRGVTNKRVRGDARKRPKQCDSARENQRQTEKESETERGLKRDRRWN